MAKEVENFFIVNGITPSYRNIHISYIAAAAIISETKLVPCAKNDEYTKYGVSI